MQIPLFIFFSVKKESSKAYIYIIFVMYTMKQRSIPTVFGQFLILSKVKMAAILAAILDNVTAPFSATT